MKTLKWVWLLCALGGCTLTLREADDELYGYEEEPAPPPLPRWGSSEPLPVVSSAREPIEEPALPEPEPVDSLRDLTIAMSGMDEEVGRFMKLRVVSKDDAYAVVGVIHSGISEPDYLFELPRSLQKNKAYDLEFYADADDSGGYTRPPADHAWRIPIPASDDDVVIDFTHNTGYVDIDEAPRKPAEALVLSSAGMSDYYRHPLDVRVIEQASGRLVGRQIREVPGDAFDLTLGGVIREGVRYDVEIAVDVDEDGGYDRIIDDSWRLTGVATAKGLFLDFTPDGQYVDVGF
jgi:hypothetical protein